MTKNRRQKLKYIENVSPFLSYMAQIIQDQRVVYASILSTKTFSLCCQTKPAQRLRRFCCFQRLIRLLRIINNTSVSKNNFLLAQKGNSFLEKAPLIALERFLSETICNPYKKLLSSNSFCKLNPLYFY